MSSSSNFGNNDPQVTKMSQAALRIKALAQLRQVLRSSPTRAGMAYNVGKDLLLLLRYLPAGIINKIQNFNLASALNSASGSDSDSKSIQQTPASAPPSPTNNGRKNKEDGGGVVGTGTGGPGTEKPSSSSRFKLLSVSLPSTPTKLRTPVGPPLTPADLLGNVLRMNTKNNTVIGNRPQVAETPKEGASASPNPDNDKNKKPPAAEPVKFSEELLEAGRLVREIQLPRFVDFSENFKAIDERTKNLILCVEKAMNSTNGSKHNLIHHLDDFFSHIYQYSDSKPTAVKCGAVKVISKIITKFPDHPHLVGRSREVLALLGCAPPTKGQGIKILAIDGGGVRGLVAVEILRVLEKLTNKKVHELFDYICGVSTGSIIAFLLGAHRQSLDMAEALYKDLSREIFSQNSFWGSATLVWSHAYYHTPTFEKILQKHCGEIPLISLAREPDLPRISAISTIVNHERTMPYVFRTYTFKPDVKGKYTGGCRYHMWEAVRASAAAPTYFEEFKLGNYLHQDGGIIVNNPTAVAIGEAKNLWEHVPIQCVVSLGTGLTVTSSTDKNIGEFMEETEKGDTYLSWKGKFLKVLDSATDTETVHNTLNELLPPDVYYRFNPYLSEVARLDETRPEVLYKMQEETREYLTRNVDRLTEVSKRLVKQKGLTRRVADWWNHI